MYVLADDAIAALGNAKRGVFTASNGPAARRALAAQQTKIRTARKFVLDDDLVRYAAKLACRMSPTQMMALIQQYSRVPYSKVWIEWNEHVRVNAIQQYVVDSCNDINSMDVETRKSFQQTLSPGGFSWSDTEEMSRTILQNSVKSAQEALDRGDAYLLENIAERCGYLIEEGNPDNVLDCAEHFFTCYYFVADNENQARARDNQKLVGSPTGYSMRFEAPYSENDHRRLLQRLIGTDFEPPVPIEEQLEHNLKNEVKFIATMNSKWWIAAHSQDPNLMNYFEYMRLVQCEPVYWWCHTENGFSAQQMQGLAERFSKVLEGDPRFIITVLALLNYDWVLKDNKARSTTPRRRFGRRVAGNSYSIVSIDLPKRRGVEVFMRDLDKDAEGTRRLHEVRGHWCVSKTTGKRWWRKSHKRGDANLGVINHDYELNHGGDEWKSSKNAASAAA